MNDLTLEDLHAAGNMMRAMRRIVNYDWQSEERDYEQQPEDDRQGHVFEDLQAVNTFLSERGF